MTEEEEMVLNVDVLPHVLVFLCFGVYFLLFFWDRLTTGLTLPVLAIPTTAQGMSLLSLGHNLPLPTTKQCISKHQTATS